MIEHAYNTTTQMMRDMADDPSWTVDLCDRPGTEMIEAIRAADEQQLLLIAWLAHLGHQYATDRMLKAKDDR